jgi:hypothetical protein
MKLSMYVNGGQCYGLVVRNQPLCRPPAHELADDLVVEAGALVEAEGLDGARRRRRIRN